VLEDDIWSNPMMAFPIKVRINTELFINRTAALYIGQTRIRDGADQGDHRGIKYTCAEAVA